MTTVRLARGVMFIVMVAVVGAAPRAAQAQEARPAAQAGDAAAQNGGPQVTPQTQIERYVVGSARPPVEPGTELIELTLEQAYALALEKNLDLRVARLNPIIQDYTLQSMRATYRPNFSGSYGYSNSLTPSNNVLDGVSSVTSIGQSFNSSVSQQVRWYGGPSLSASFSNSRSSTNNVTARLNPGYNTSLRLNFSMQLLNGFKIDNQRNQWRTFPINREIADLQLLQTIDSIRNQVRTSYWTLRQAIEQIEIARRALEIAKRQWSDALLRVEIGTSAPIDTVGFESQVASAEQSYLNAQISWRQAELNFKRLLVSGMDDELYSRTINPVDRPELTVQSVDIQAAVGKALAERTDAIISRKNLEVRRLNLEVTEQALRPNLSFSAGYGASGQGGTQHVGGVTIPGGYGDALGALGSFSNPNWSLSFNINYPLGQLSQKASVATARIQIDQAVAQMKVQELTISTAVINAGLAVENSYKQYLAAVKSREASERNAEAGLVRLENGMATNFEVVQLQQSLTNARLSELNAIIRYMNALAEFDRVQRIGG